MKSIYYLLIITSLTLSACGGSQQKTGEKAAPPVTSDPLPSWNETPTKKAIIDFVTAITGEGSAKFIPAEERVAVFDNDGTLWCEQPMYFEVLYSLAGTKAIVAKKPELAKKPEMKALLDGDMKKFMASGEKGIVEAFAVSHAAVPPVEFDKMAATWLDTAVHRRFNKKYSELIYAPMVELLQYLRDNGFKTYIVSGGSSVFIRLFSDKAYGIPPEQVIGTMLKAEYKNGDVVFTPELWHNDDNVGKPVGIFQLIGRKPVFAFGNSDGDYQMLEWTSSNTRPNLSLILHHTDADREYAYDRNSHVGKLDKGLTDGPTKGWIIVDMKKDFGKVFSFEK